jgi:LuxR family maltose regulon positive regulatory protein
VTRLLGRRGDLDGVDPQLIAGLVAAPTAGPAAGAPAAPGNGLVEPVTDRESVVLRYLPSLLTVVDIAGELGVSPNTVKTQMKSLYRKLSVENRRGAVQRARQLGLL